MLLGFCQGLLRLLIPVRKAQSRQAHKRGGSGQGSAVEQDFFLKWKKVHDGSVTDSASRAQNQVCLTAQGLAGLRDASILNKDPEPLLADIGRA